MDHYMACSAEQSISHKKKWDLRLPVIRKEHHHHARKCIGHRKFQVGNAVRLIETKG
jgi:hypothetical protein